MPHHPTISNCIHGQLDNYFWKENIMTEHSHGNQPIIVKLSRYFTVFPTKLAWNNCLVSHGAINVFLFRSIEPLIDHTCVTLIIRSNHLFCLSVYQKTRCDPLKRPQWNGPASVVLENVLISGAIKQLLMWLFIGMLKCPHILAFCIQDKMWSMKRPQWNGMLELL